MTKITHGGKRKGSGRKPLTTPKKTVSVKLDPAEIDKLNEVCRSKQLSQAGTISAWINNEPAQEAVTD
jgi:hypothetical protein